VERATGGWRVGFRSFGLPFLIQENPRTQWLVYVVPTFALLAGYPLVIALVLGGLGWFTIRRATP
jgi:hypothetical protein